MLAQLDAEIDVATEDAYTGSSSYQYAAGYTVTANYSVTVARTDCETVTYTAIFGSMPAPKGDSAGEAADTTAAAEPMDTTPLVIGAVVLAIAVGGVFGVKKLKERR